MPSPPRNDTPEDSGGLQSEHHTIYTTGTDVSHAINVNKHLTLKIKKIFNKMTAALQRLDTHIYK